MSDHKDAGQAGSGEQFFDVEETHATGWVKGTVRYTWTQLLDTFEEGSLTRVIMDSHASLSAENATLREQIDAMANVLEMVKVAAINARGLDFNLSSSEWSIFHAALSLYRKGP